MSKLKMIGSDVFQEQLDYDESHFDRAIIRRGSRKRLGKSSYQKSSKEPRSPKCHTKKKKYRDKREADRARHLTATKHIRHGYGLNAYRVIDVKRSYQCYCGYWHLTSMAEYVKTGLVS